jgi:hypothetical protein
MNPQLASTTVVGLSAQSAISYQTSIHGRAVAQGSTKAAVCTDCHDHHAVRPANDPLSGIFKFNVARTCGKCHPAIAATARPGTFTGPGVVGAHGAVAPPPKAPTAGQPNTAHGAPNTEAPKKGAPPAASAKPQAQKPHPKGDSDRDKKHEAEDAGKPR